MNEELSSYAKASADMQETLETPAIETEDEVIEEQVEQQQEDKEKINFKEMRAKTRQLEEERDEAYRVIQQMKQQQASPKPPIEEEDEYKIDDEDLVDGKKYNKLAQEVRHLKKELRQHSETSIETRLKQQYNDFDKVVNEQNVAMLKKLYPELASTLGADKNLYSQAVSAYTMIKQMGIYKTDEYTQEKKIVEKNMAKPRPLASVSPQKGNDPLSKANVFAGGLTEDLKAQLYKEMKEAQRRC